MTYRREGQLKEAITEVERALTAQAELLAMAKQADQQADDWELHYLETPFWNIGQRFTNYRTWKAAERWRNLVYDRMDRDQRKGAA